MEFISANETETCQ